jgi:hypothetical protein
MIVPRDVEVVTHNEWISMNSSVRNMAVDIAKSIKEAHEKIAKARKLAEDAQNKKGFLWIFGKQKKINEAISKAQMITSEAMYSHSKLIQQSIKLTICSLETASDMQKALAYLAVNGIREANGRVETLALECTESINTIIEHARDFIQQQAEIEDRQNELSERIENLRNQRVNEERIKKLETELREVIAINRQFDEKELNRLKEEYRTEMLKLKFTFLIICGSIAAIAVAGLILSIVL